VLAARVKAMVHGGQHRGVLAFEVHCMEW
jgi:hypothetical protein